MPHLGGKQKQSCRLVRALVEQTRTRQHRGDYFIDTSTQVAVPQGEQQLQGPKLCLVKGSNQRHIRNSLAVRLIDRLTTGFHCGESATQCLIGSKSNPCGLL